MAYAPAMAPTTVTRAAAPQMMDVAGLKEQAKTRITEAEAKCAVLQKSLDDLTEQQEAVTKAHAEGSSEADALRETMQAQQQKAF